MLVIQNADGTQSSYEVRRFVYAGALSQCYTLTLDVVDPTNRLAGQSLLFRPASLQYLGSGGDNETISGLITQVTQQKDPVKQTPFYQILIEPYLSLLTLQREFKAYNNESYLTISQGLIRNLSASQGLSNYVDFQITMPWLISPLQTHDIACEDSDLDYFNKILGFARYYFDQSANPEKLVVIDRPSLLPTREQTLLFDPTRKEDLKNNAPAFYSLSLKKEAQNLSAQPFYFDPKNPEESLKTLQNSNPLLYETRIYAPLNWYDFLKMKLTEQMSSATELYTFKGYYSHLNVGERIMLQSALGNGAFEAFVESIQIEGHYQDDVWRFDVEGVLRPYAPTGIWLGPVNLRKPIPAVLTGGILQEANHVNDFGEYQVKLPLGFNVGDISPTISVREIQETVTSDGGASHSVSGTSDTVLISQDGLPSDLLLTGSLIDNKRTSHISSESYREAGVQMKGGLKMHMRRSDGNNSYSELGTSLKDSQGNTAHLTMGANSQTLSQQGDRAHGIITQSTGYAKRVVSGNDYDTVGDPNNPVTQKSLVNQNGQTVHSTQTNVGSGVYQQTYYTQAAGVKVNNAAAQAPQLQTTPAIKHYFYVAPQLSNISDLADQLYGANPSAQKDLFSHINLQAYGINIPAGAWVYIPATQTYKADDLVAVNNALSQIQSQVDQSNQDDLSAYGLWHQVFGWNFENGLTYTGTLFTTSSSQVNSQLSNISQTLNKIGQINQQAKNSVFSGNAASAAMYREQAQILGEELHQDVNQLVSVLGIADPAFSSSFTSDTGLNYDRNVLGYKANGLSDTDLSNLTTLKLQSIKMAQIAKGANRLGLAIDGVANVDDVAETCQKYGDGSTLCHKTAVGDTANFGASQYAGAAAGSAVGEWAGCNAAFDIETAGLGIIGCTVAVGAASIISGSIVGNIAKETTEASYQRVVIYSQQYGVNNK